MNGYSKLWMDEFFIPKEKLEEAYQAAVEASLPVDCKDKKNLEEMFEWFGFGLFYDSAGNVRWIITLTPIIKISPHFEPFLDSIAPFIKAESFIRMTDLDGEFWEWYFDGSKVNYRTGELVFRENVLK